MGVVSLVLIVSLGRRLGSPSHCHSRRASVLLFLLPVLWEILGLYSLEAEPENKNPTKGRKEMKKSSFELG